MTQPHAPGAGGFMEVAYAMKGRGAGEVKGESLYGHHMNSYDIIFKIVRNIHIHHGKMAPWRLQQQSGRLHGGGMRAEIGRAAGGLGEQACFD